MTVKEDIKTIEDIRLMVDQFYMLIRTDELLGPIFNGVIEDRWPQHLEKMYIFWQTVLLGQHTYVGSPFGPHANMPIQKIHFDRWKMLFFKTVDTHFSGSKSDEAKWRAEKMAEMFLMKINFYQKTDTKQILE
ncbi:MAG: group III truncated hemoglobin [Saprospiraceae bacterium]